MVGFDYKICLINHGRKKYIIIGLEDLQLLMTLDPTPHSDRSRMLVLVINIARKFAMKTKL